MTMFGIPAGTRVRLIPKDTYATSGFHRSVPYTTREFKVFDVSDLTVDPSGINKDASGPSDRTIGGAWAAAGWYVFALADPYRYPHGPPDSKWRAVGVPADRVEVDGAPAPNHTPEGFASAEGMSFKDKLKES